MSAICCRFARPWWSSRSERWTRQISSSRSKGRQRQFWKFRLCRWATFTRVSLCELTFASCFSSSRVSLVFRKRIVDVRSTYPAGGKPQMARYTMRIGLQRALKRNILFWNHRSCRLKFSNVHTTCETWCKTNCPTLKLRLRWPAHFWYLTLRAKSAA